MTTNVAAAKAGAEVVGAVMAAKESEALAMVSIKFHKVMATKLAKAHTVAVVVVAIVTRALGYALALRSMTEFTSHTLTVKKAANMLADPIDYAHSKPAIIALVMDIATSLAIVVV